MLFNEFLFKFKYLYSNPNTLGKFYLNSNTFIFISISLFEFNYFYSNSNILFDFKYYFAL